jgi:G3E family GTPase
MLLKNFPIFKGDGPYIPVLVDGLIRSLYFRPSYPKLAGWQGIRHTTLFGRCWSARITRHLGVFGFMFEGEKTEPGLVRSDFSLYYFPHPDEKLLEVFPLAAMAIAQENDYTRIIGNFPALGQGLGLFQTGRMELCAGLSGKWMQISVSALSRQRVITREGISLPDGRCLVQPSGYESDVPAWLLSFALFRSLATTAGIVLSQGPELTLISRSPGEIMELGRSGAETTEHSGISRLTLSLGFGELPPDFSTPAKGFYLPRNFRVQPWQDPAGITDSRMNPKGYRPDFVIFSGFLGSGKTSLIRDLLDRQMQKNCFTAVIQNEVGRENLDGKLLKGECELEEMDEGCVCCTLSGQIRRGVSRILDRFRPDMIILETSGVANPANITDDYKAIRDLVKPGPVITVVDALHFEGIVEKSGLAGEQVKAADLIIIAKADLVPEHSLEGLIKTVGEINKNSRVFAGRKGRVNWSELLRLSENNFKKDQAPVEFIDENKAILPDMKDIAGLTHEDEGFETLTLDFSRALDKVDLQRAMENTGPGIYRIKGIVDFNTESTPFLVQKTGGKIDMDPLHNPRTDKRFLVFIGQGLDQENLDLFSA